MSEAGDSPTDNPKDEPSAVQSPPEDIGSNEEKKKSKLLTGDHYQGIHLVVLIHMNGIAFSILYFRK